MFSTHHCMRAATALTDPVSVLGSREHTRGVQASLGCAAAAAGPGRPARIGGLPPAAVAAGGEDDDDDADDMDLDIGCEGAALRPAGTPLKLEATPAAAAAGADSPTAARREGQFVALVAQPAAAHPAAAARGGRRSGGGHGVSRSGGGSGGRTRRQGSHSGGGSRSRSASAVPSLSTCDTLEDGDAQTEGVCVLSKP